MATKSTPEPAEPETPPADEDVPRWAGAMQTTCIGCTRTDNHPKKLLIHNIGTDDEYVVRWHHDCHAIATGDAHSQAVVDQSGGVRGQALREFLHGNPDTGSAPMFDPDTVPSTPEA